MRVRSYHGIERFFADRIGGFHFGQVTLDQRGVGDGGLVVAERSAFGCLFVPADLIIDKVLLEHRDVLHVQRAVAVDVAQLVTVTKAEGHGSGVVIVERFIIRMLLVDRAGDGVIAGRRVSQSGGIQSRIITRFKAAAQVITFTEHCLLILILYLEIKGDLAAEILVGKIGDIGFKTAVVPDSIVFPTMSLSALSVSLRPEKVRSG